MLDLGPHHPSTHGGLQLALVLDGDVVVRAEPVVGFMHRGAEKLFEVRDYRQVLVLADRHDWLSAFGNELGVVLAVERMLGMVLPERAVWLRTLLAELTRAVNHLSFVAAPRSAPPAASARRCRGCSRRSPAAGCTTASTGSAGCTSDVPAGWTGRARRALALRARRRAGAARARAATTPGGRGVGVLARADALSYGVSGAARPRVRASTSTCAATTPTSPTPSSTVRVPLGDAPATATPASSCLLEQLQVALDLAEACLDRLPPGAGRAAAAQDGQGARGAGLLLDREPARRDGLTTW